MTDRSASIAPWQTRPLFVTSTFADMQAERDHLRDHVFPALAERLRERRHHLETIDLRWGVETVSLGDGQAKELLVLKVCLGEIVRSRPFLIGLIGDRYGWVPPPGRMRSAIAEQNFATDVRGKSVTALEIEFGVLDSADQKRRSHFYFRQPLPYSSMPQSVAALFSEKHNPAPGAADAANRLKALKERIQSDPSLKGRVHDYDAEWDAAAQQVTGLKEWGNEVLKHLWSDLDAETLEFARAPLPSWQDQERWALEEFVENRGRGFIGRVEITRELIDHAASPAQDLFHWGVCVTGVSGSGKSALFAHLQRELAKRDDVLLLSHAAGISLRAGQVDAMLRRWTRQLATALNIADSLADDATTEQIEEAFHQLLSRASTGRRVVLLIDAINQFDPTPRAQYLTWLPKLFPANARLIATAIPGTESAALVHRSGVRDVPLPRLDINEARAIVYAVCERYHRKIHPDIVQALLDKKLSDEKPSAGIPLWLELAVEELNLLDADDFARAQRDYQGNDDQKLHQMMRDVARELPPDVEGLYGHMLRRAEEIAGWNWAMAFATLIAASRHGLRESDLEKLLSEQTGEPWDGLRFATLRRAFRAHLVQRGGLAQWDFFHAQMRAAVWRAYPDNVVSTRGLHKSIADHLLGLPREDRLHETETMVHLMRIEDLQLAAAYYGGDLTRDEEAGATGALAREVISNLAGGLANPLSAIVSLLEQHVSNDELGRLANRFLFPVNNAVATEAPLDVRLTLLDAARMTMERLSTSDSGQAQWQHDLLVSHSNIGDVLRAQGDLSGAAQSYHKTHAIIERLAAGDPNNAQWQRDLCVSHNKIGDILTAQGDLGGAARAYRVSLEISKRLVEADESIAEWQGDLSSSYEKISDVLKAEGNLAGAVQSFRASLKIRERLAAADPGNAAWQKSLSIIHIKIGDVLVARGDLGCAARSFRASLEIAESLAAADPGNAEWQHDLSLCHQRIGDVLRAQGNLTGAIGAYGVSLEIVERLVGTDSTNSNWQASLSINRIQIGDVLIAQGNLAGAVKSYRAAQEIAERLAAADPGNAQWQRNLSVSHEKIGNVLSAQGNLASAFRSYCKTNEILKRLAAADPGNAERQQDLSISYIKIGNVLSAQGDLAGAACSYRASVEIAKRLAAADPVNAELHNGLSNSQILIGDVLRAQGDLAGAAQAYCASLKIMDRLAAADQTNTQRQRDLSLSHERFGDVLTAQGDLAGAVRSFRECQEIRRRLVDADPGNANWQRDLLVSQNKIGNVLIAQGNLAGAAQAFRAGLEIAESLVAAAPGNTHWQRDLSISHTKMGDVFGALGDLASAARAYLASLEICERLAAADPGNAEWQRDLVVSYYKLASHCQQADTTAASNYWRRCRDVLRRMKARRMFLDAPLVQLLEELENFP